MSKIKIVTDSTVDMTDELIRKYDIEVVPLSIQIEGETYLDRVDLTPKDFLNKMKVAKELPKSSQPPVGVFAETYDRLGSEGYDVLSIHMTGGMSGTVQSAETAASMSTANVRVVDSRFISKALSFQVIEASQMAKEGKSMDEILARLDQIRSNTRLFVVVDTLENLVKGGRIGKGKAMIGSLLNIKPIASLEGGVYTPVSKARSYSQVATYLAKQFAEDTAGHHIKGVGLVHAEAPDLNQKLISALKTIADFDLIDIEYTTPIVSTHTGPGAIGFMYYFD